jgi:hypothetical protein
MIKKRIRLKRRINDAMNEILNRQNTVCNDSVFTHPAGTARLVRIKGSPITRGYNYTLGWEIRKPDWLMRIADSVSRKVLAYDVYGTTSHKYWLRSLIRRCR